MTQFLYKTQNGTILEVVANQNYEFELKLTKNQETLIYSITKDDCNYDKINPSIISFEDHNYLIDLED